MNTQQSHKLRQTWEAQDYANSAQQSAHAAQQYYQLVSRKVNAMQSEIDGLKFDREALKKEVRRLESNVNDSHRTALVWGAGGAIVAAIVINLIIAPQPNQYRPPVNRYQIGGS